MKTPIAKVFGSKTIKTLFTMIILTLPGLSACKKGEAVKSTGVTEADAVELTTDALIPSTGGFAAQATTSTSLYTAKAGKISCGTVKDTTITMVSLSGITPSYGYTLSWNYELDCSANEFTFNFTGTSDYNGARMSYNGASTGSLVLTGILPSSSAYTLNTTYERKGNATSKIGNQNSFTSDLKITSTNITIDKTLQQISGGTATITITGATTGGKSFSFNGTLTFLGSKKATLVLNSGASYTIQWS